MLAILCFFHTHHGYYTIANIFDWYIKPSILTYLDTLASCTCNYTYNF